MRKLVLLFLSISLLSCNFEPEGGLVKNYEHRKTQIRDLIKFFNSIVPEGYLVSIRYASKDKLSFLKVYEPKDDSEALDLYFQKWDIDINDYLEKPQSEYDKKYNGKTNSLELTKTRLNWNSKTFNKLFEKIRAAGCIGITNTTNTQPVKIDCKYKGMGVLGYYVFDHNLVRDEQEKYSNDCSKIFYKDNIVFVYGSGVIGNFCIDEFDRSKKMAIP